MFIVSIKLGVLIMVGVGCVRFLRSTLERHAKRLSLALLIFAMWQIEITFIFMILGWNPDIFWIKLPTYICFTFYNGLLGLSWVLLDWSKEVEKTKK